MGKIAYGCMIDPDYLEDMIESRHLPRLFQKSVKAKKLDSEAAEEKLRKFFLKKFPAAKKQRMSFSLFRKAKPTKEREISAKPCWFLDAVDKLDGKDVKVTDCHEAAYTPDSAESKEMERIVHVSCEFTKGSEVKDFLSYTIHSGLGFVGKTKEQIIDEINKQMDSQLTKLKKETIGELKPKDKIKVKIDYKLKY